MSIGKLCHHHTITNIENRANIKIDALLIVKSANISGFQILKEQS